eukprot:6303239-Amphidinium_carterae.1
MKAFSIGCVRKRRGCVPICLRNGLESSERLNSGTRARSQNCKVNLSDTKNNLVKVSAILLNEK